MIDKANGTKDDRLRYRIPEVKEIPVKVHGILCWSEMPMYERDCGDGGFSTGY